MPLNPRAGRPRTRATRAYRAECQAVAAPCWLCRNPIDYMLERQRHPLRFSVDELIPISRGGDALDTTLFRPAHACCNSCRGNRPPTPAVRRACAIVYRRHHAKHTERRTVSAPW